ncbi:hypothetical protein L6452_34484 [Arctium lappa]|uniref:Uncharacterized protein n=1 Tax=Arctium lappa TaxID=4217 RepID=A0ACB8YJ26_ARCLA|nr:hypothetical protein L6452_34484 [Arctium lappa]
MDLRQEADEESQQEDSNDGENFEEPHNQNTDFEKEVTIRREEETWTEGSGKVRDGLKTCISPKEDKIGGNKSSHVSDTIGENGGPGQSLLGVGDPNKNPANLISPLDSDTEIHNWRVASGTDNQKEGNKEGKQSKGGQSKVRGKEKIEAEKNKAKMKKRDIFGLGRGKLKRCIRIREAVGNLVGGGESGESADRNAEIIQVDLKGRGERSTILGQTAKAVAMVRGGVKWIRHQKLIDDCNGFESEFGARFAGLFGADLETNRSGFREVWRLATAGLFALVFFM